MGGVVSAVPAADSVIDVRPDGSTLFRVKVLAGVSALASPGATALLAICEDELQLLLPRPPGAAGGIAGGHPTEGSKTLARYDYTRIPFWSITPEFFAFKHRQLDGVAAIMVRLATLQAKQISETLRQVSTPHRQFPVDGYLDHLPTPLAEVAGASFCPARLLQG